MWEVADLATLITAIGGGLAAILGPVVTLIIALRRVSPREREDAATNASTTDRAQDDRIAELEQRLRDLAPPPEDPS